MSSRTASAVEAKGLHYVQALGTSNDDPAVNALQQSSVAECTIHFCRKDLPCSEMLSRVHYIGVGDSDSMYPGLTSVGSSV